MKKPTAIKRLKYARKTIKMLENLQQTDKEMTYADLSRAIGLLGDDEKWHVLYKKPITEILCLAAAVEKQAGTFDLDRYQRIINKHTGRAGEGVWRDARIMRTPLGVEAIG